VDLAPAKLSSSSPAALEAWRTQLQDVIQGAGITPDRTVVFYEDISGTMAPYGVWLLDAAGLGNGVMLDGGIRGWHAAGHPLSKESVTATRSTTTIAPRPAVIATADDILADLSMGNGATQRVDTRAAHEHASGAIPGAVNIDWTTHLDPATGAFKPLDQIAAMYDEAGLNKEQETTSYCAGGFRAANTYVVMRALGFAHARNYAPSWSEWGMRPDTPKE
jgi:thiosulfate/3-mercaptopyruvate sulfurtransferase